MTISHSFNFKLSDIEIDTLTENIKLIEKLMLTEYVTPNIQINGKWEWINPQIR